MTRRFEFAAAHHLPNYDGVCSNEHGHSYVLDVTVEGFPMANGPKQGMIIDFQTLKKIVEGTVLSRLDHTDLNKIYPVPTAEMMVRDIFQRLKLAIKDLYFSNAIQEITADVRLLKVRLWESPGKAYSEYSEE